MAAGGPVRELCEELTCPICLDCFMEPVILPECGHNFCRACLDSYWGERATEASCPVCKRPARARDLRPNRQLANVVEIAQKLRLQGGDARKEDAPERLCGRHREPLKLFCRTDGILVCTVCDRSNEHRSHEVLPAEEAAQEFKDKIFSCLETLRTEREKILVSIVNAEDESQEILKTTESEKQKTVAEFRALRQFLEEREKHLLSQIEEVEKEVARKRDGHLAKLSEELSSFESLIREMEEKQQQPVNELLQDVRKSLQRCEEKENFETPVAFFSDLKWRLQACCDIGPFLGGIVKQFKDTLGSGLQLQEASVTLDPETAHPFLIVSPDCKGVKWGAKAQDLTQNPERFDTHTVVLGREEFRAGRHFWDVVVGHKGGWAVGVARKSVRRKGDVAFTPEGGIWEMGWWNGSYQAALNDHNPILCWFEDFDSIRVFLNCDEGRVAFFVGEWKAKLYEYKDASLAGETLQPFFWVHKNALLRLVP